MGMDMGMEEPPPAPDPAAGAEQASTAPKLAMVLRSLIGAADEKKLPLFLHFDKPNPNTKKTDAMNIDLNQAMRNAGGENFDYGMFKAAYDTDPRVKTMVANFSQDGIEAKTEVELQDKDTSGEEAAAAEDPNGVEQLAKQATDVSNLGPDM